MKLRYCLEYAWKDIWHSQSKPFSIMNITAISISVAILVILTGGFLAFRENAKKMLSGEILKIEVTARGKEGISEEQKKQLGDIPQEKSIYLWTPTILLFYSKNEGLHGTLGGETIDLKDRLINKLADIRDNSPIKLQTKEQLKTTYDEFGLIVPFSMIRTLGYLPKEASLKDPATWGQDSFPQKLKVRIKENKLDSLPVDLDVPIIGIISDELKSRYLMTKDCYQLFRTWQNSYNYFIKDRNGKPLTKNTPPPGITNTIPRGFLHEETHASVYVKHSEDLLLVIDQIRELGLKADCPLENYLKKYKQQESFFMVAAGFICLALFFFSGIVLFANFHALVLRKYPEIGILKACGLSRHLITRIFSLEVGILCFLAISLGLSTGYSIGENISVFVQKYIQNEGAEMAKAKWFMMPWEYLAIIFGSGMLFGWLVTFFPVRMATSVDPDKVIRV